MLRDGVAGLYILIRRNLRADFIGGVVKLLLQKQTHRRVCVFDRFTGRDVHVMGLDIFREITAEGSSKAFLADD
jgi:hypothetical protein